MATIIERDVSSGGDNGSSMATAVVAIIGIAVILGLALLFFRNGFPGSAPANDSIRVNVEGQLPAPTPAN